MPCPGYDTGMESVVRSVKGLESDERRVYEAVLGCALQDNQQVLVMVLNPGAAADDSIRRKAVEEFHELCREGTEHRERLGVSIEEADQVLEEALRAVRSRKTA